MKYTAPTSKTTNSISSPKKVGQGLGEAMGMYPCNASTSRSLPASTPVRKSKGEKY